jgi:hypothetical protein
VICIRWVTHGTVQAPRSHRQKYRLQASDDPRCQTLKTMEKQSTDNRNVAGIVFFLTRACTCGLTHPLSIPYKACNPQLVAAAARTDAFYSTIPRVKIFCVAQGITAFKTQGWFFSIANLLGPDSTVAALAGSPHDDPGFFSYACERNRNRNRNGKIAKTPDKGSQLPLTLLTSEVLKSQESRLKSQDSRLKSQDSRIIP